MRIKPSDVGHVSSQKGHLPDNKSESKIMYTDEEYIQNLIDNDPVNKWRKCIVEEWDGDLRVCESCQMEMPENCIYMCDKCFCLYCIVCVEEEAFCESGKNVYTFCTKDCLDEYIEETGTVILKECKVCHTMCTPFEIQRIDQAIGQVCYFCLM